MKFFIPGLKEGADSEREYEKIRQDLLSQGWRPLSPDRIYKIEYRCEEKSGDYAVGKETGEGTVLSIFESNDLYLICTPSRGLYALGTVPLIIPKRFATSVEKFD